jgi:hypothetical protein
VEANGTPASTGLAGPADGGTVTGPAGHPNTRTAPAISAAATASIRLGRTWLTSASSFVDAARTRAPAPARARTNTRAAANSGALTHPGDACTATC